MKKVKLNYSQNSKGFTIIEVVLVLAVAGLIFLMIFLALPALQRSQRDLSRKNNTAIVAEAIKRWQANNRGKSIASMGVSEVGDDTNDEDKVEGASGMKKVNAVPNGPLDDYLSVKDETNDTSKSSLGAETEKIMVYSSKSEVTKGRNIHLSYDSNDAAEETRNVRVFVGYSCPQDNSVSKTQAGKNSVRLPKSAENKVAIVTFLESGGFYCQDL